MPKESLSIYFTIQDGASKVLSSIGDKTKALDKETQQLAQAYKALEAANKPLIQKQKDLEVALADQSKAVSEARKEYKKYGDELSATRLQDAIDQQQQLKNELRDVEGQISSNQKTYKEYQETIRKGSSSSGASTTSLASTLGAAGVWSALGDLGSEIGLALAGSAYGSEGGTIASGLLSGAASGAAMGTMINAGIGTAVGAVVGAIGGAISSAVEIAGNKDDAFKEYYADLYEQVNEATEEMISGGSTTAGSREQTFMAFSKRLGGDEAARTYLDKVQAFSAQTNYGYDEITGYSQQLLNTYDPDEVFGVLQTLSDATAGLSLSSSDVNVMISGLSRMRTTGKATQEYLNYFSERGVDVYTALAEALGVDKSQIAGMVTKGQIGGEFAAGAILDYIDSTYGGLSADLMGTYDAMVDNLGDIKTTLDAAAGEGYNNLRKEGLTAETEAYSGALGEALEEVNRVSGENAAYLENLSEQYTREALSAVLLGEKTTVFSPEDQAKLEGIALQYEQASAEYAAGNQEAGLTMERLREEAEALATASYESSDQYLALHEAEMDEIDAIRANTKALEAATLAYQKNQNLSKGGAAAVVDGETGIVSAKKREFYEDPMYHAYGLRRVPRNEYPALLHEDERVLTASETRALEAGTGTQIVLQVSGNNFVGAGEEMADQVMEIIAPKLEEALMLLG